MIQQWRGAGWPCTGVGSIMLWLLCRCHLVPPLAAACCRHSAAGGHKPRVCQPPHRALPAPDRHCHRGPAAVCRLARHQARHRCTCRCRRRGKALSQQAAHQSGPGLTAPARPARPPSCSIAALLQAAAAGGACGSSVPGGSQPGAPAGRPHALPVQWHATGWVMPARMPVSSELT